MTAEPSTFRDLRLARAWSLLELSRRAGLPVSELSDLERGKGAGAAALSRLSALYGLALSTPALPPGLQELLSRPGVALRSDFVARLCRLEFRSGYALSADEWASLAATLTEAGD